LPASWAPECLNIVVRNVKRSVRHA